MSDRETCERCQQPIDDHATATVDGMDHYWICPVSKGHAVSEVVSGFPEVQA